MRVPDSVRALLFDMDGVLTDTARVHAGAWQQTFDAVLDELGSDAPRFDTDADYRAYVDGKSRLDGVRSFLEARGVELPEGEADDGPQALTVRGVGRRKNDLVLELIRSRGVDRYEGSLRFVEQARAKGLQTAVVSSSANAREALRSAGMDELFDTWVDGVRIDEEGLPGKPAPDTFLAAARDLGVSPAHAAVLEDALAGVAAGRAGDFGWVVGVDRTGHPDDLRKHGADVVVRDLEELELA
nr:beta-phosphoglucomutase family hydrolase [Conexibacter sp. SYSU D00693]